MASDPTFLTQKASLHNVMELNTRRLLEEVPIVSNTRERKYLGMVFVYDVIGLYNSEIQKRDLALACVTRKKYKDITEGISLGEGYRLTEIALPESFAGQSLKELAFRNRFNLEIILIKRSGKPDLIPDAETSLETGDRVVVVGVLDDIKSFRKSVSQ